MEVHKKGKTAIIILSGIKDLNLLNWEILEEFYISLLSLEKDNEIRVVIITGKGNKAFSAGTDLHVEMELEGEIGGRKWSELGHKIIKKIEEMPFPVICAMKGYALGGGMEIAMACDIIIASEDAKFGLPEVKYGVIPGWGGTTKLSGIVGKYNAAEILLSGETISANEAHRIGLVNKVSKEPLEEAEKIALKISENAPLSIRTIKGLLNNSIHKTMINSMEKETEEFSKCFATEDQKEGMKSFFDKRKPLFKGK